MGRHWATLAACILVSLLNEVGGAVLTLDMPAAAADIGASKEASQFILLAGKLSLGALLLAGGGIGDRFGRKHTMLVGVALAALASVLSALSRTVPMLAGARILDGLGNALVGPLALALAVTSFPEAMRGRVIGLFLGVTGLGVAIGPLAAGALVQGGGWRAGFAAPLGLALVGGLAIALLVEAEPPERRRPPSDPVGIVLCILGLVALVLGFVRAGSGGWDSLATLALLAGGVAGLGAFGWWEVARAPVPLLDPALLRSREVLAALAAALVAAIVLNGTALPLLYFMQRVEGHEPVAAVMRLSPLIVAALGVAPMAGGLAERLGRRWVMAGGLAAIVAGAGLMASLTTTTPYPMVAAALVLIGGGVMAVATPAADLVMATTGVERSGSAAALNGAVMQVGGALGIGTLTSIFLSAGLRGFVAEMTARGYSREQWAAPARRLREIVRDTTLDQLPQLPEISSRLQQDIVDAYAQAFAAGVGRCFLVAAVLALAALVVVLLGMPSGPRRLRRPAARPAAP